MPVGVMLPEPAARPKPNRGDYCDRAAKGILNAMLDVDAGVRRVGLDFKESASARLNTVVNWTRNLGPGGEEMSRQIQTVSDGAQRMTGEMLANLDKVSRYSRDAKYDAALAHYSGEGMEALGGKAREVYDLLDIAFESILHVARLLEVRRQMPSGEMLPIKGSGRAYPTILSKKGLRAARDAANNKRSGDALEAAVRVTFMNHPAIRKGLEGLTEEELDTVYQVAMGHTPEGASDAAVAAGEAIRENVEFGFAKLTLMHDQSMRGVVPYLERTRVDLPEDMLNLDPVSGLPGFYRRIGLMLSAFREWGPDLLGLDAALGRMEKDNGARHAVLIRNYIGLQLGHPGVGGLPQEGRLLQHARDLTMLRLFGGTLIGPLRNAGQPFTNGIDQPIGAHVRALKELPPFVHRWVKGAEPLREAIIRSGAKTSENPLTEVSGTGVGPMARKAAVVHMGVIGENEYRAAATGYFGVLQNVQRLMTMQGEKGPLAKAWLSVRHLSVDPESAVGRSLERSGLDPKRIDELRKKAQDATPEELQAMVGKPTEQLTEEEWLTAIRRASLDTQFGYSFADRHVFSGQDNAYSLIYMVKNWGVRQLGFIHNYVLKEAARGNGKPLAKLLATTFVLGEVYNNVRDIATGQERSLLQKAQAGQADAQTIAFTVIKDIGDGGGLGILMDVMFGWQSLVFGPMGSTGMNILRASQHVAQDKGQAVTAAKDLLDREFVFTSQARGLLNRIKAADQAKHERFFGYGQWRDRSFTYLNKRDNPSVGDKIQAGTMRFLRGSHGQVPTERSLTYRQAAKAITGNDVDGAASYMTRLLRTADRDPKERRSILQGLDTAKRHRSPLGPVPKKELIAFLRAFSPEERAEARALQREWERDWNAAVRKARIESRGPR